MVNWVMIPAQNYGLLANAGISRSEVQRALDIRAATRTQKVLPALVLVYLAVSAAIFILASDQSVEIPGWSAYLTGAASLVSWMLLRREHVEANRVHVITAVVGTLILIQGLAEFYATSNLIFAGVI